MKDNKEFQNIDIMLYLYITDKDLYHFLIGNSDDDKYNIY